MPSIISLAHLVASVLIIINYTFRKNSCCIYTRLLHKWLEGLDLFGDSRETGWLSLSQTINKPSNHHVEKETKSMFNILKEMPQEANKDKKLSKYLVSRYWKKKKGDGEFSTFISSLSASWGIFFKWLKFTT